MTILYINHETTTLGGCSYSLENMLQSLSGRITPIILFRERGLAFDYFNQRGYDCYVIPFKLNILKTDKRGVKYYARKVNDWIFNRVAKGKIEKLVKRKRVDIIHSNTSVMTIGIESALHLNLPHVWHFREFQDLDFGMQPFCGMRRFREFMGLSNVVIAISEAIYHHWNMDEHAHAYILRNAVRSRKELISCDERGKNVLFCSSRLTKSKGADVALDIFAKSGLSEKGYQLIYVGQISNQQFVDELKQTALTYGIEGSIKFEGFQTDVSSYMKRSRAFLMCSENEALGRVTIEAMFYGCPVIARDSGGTTEFIQNGQNGFLWRNEDEAAAYLRGIEDSSIRRIVERAKETASNTFSIEEYGERIYSIYESIYCDRCTH